METRQLKCSICGSDKIKEGVEYADNKPEGQNSTKSGDEIIKHYCLTCEEYF